MDIRELINSILDDFENFNMDDIPNIDLYMDQVTTYLNGKFRDTKRKEDDKQLTKTMINNYAKSRLLPSPEKKKYTKDHILVLTMIYFFKNIISINDTNTAISPLIKEHFHNDDSGLEDIFSRFLDCIRNADDRNAILANYEKSLDCFTDMKGADREYIQKLTFIAMLSYECLSRKIIIERLIDSLPQEDESANTNDKSKSSKSEEKVKTTKS